MAEGTSRGKSQGTSRVGPGKAIWLGPGGVRGRWWLGGGHRCRQGPAPWAAAGKLRTLGFILRVVRNVGGF